MIRVYRSNRAEVLVEALAEVLAEPGGGPLEPEWLVVQGRGMATWLSRELARHHGVCTNVDFRYPRNFLLRVAELVLGEASIDAFARPRLTWELVTLLDLLPADPAYEVLRRYLRSDAHESAARRFELCERVADCFDQYLTYRPEMMLGWEQGELVGPSGGALSDDDHWQPLLWRALVARVRARTPEARHVATLERDLLAALARATPRTPLPARLSLFGLASLPPLYLRTAVALAARIEVHHFSLSPSREHWTEGVSLRRVARARLRAAERGARPDELLFEGGHPLLASLGRLGAELDQTLSAEAEAQGVAELEPAELYRAPEETTLLGALQADLLADRPPSARAGDDSIAVHVCHSPMREVEVLHDQLLRLFDTMRDLQPHEVVVMMPEVERYAPLVDAVFERERDGRFIPYRVADRSLRSDAAAIDAFLRLLAAAGGRARAADVIDLLALEPVARRFELAPDEIEVLTRWVVDSGVRWGIDGQHRASHGQPAATEHTWRFGLERMFLGYALPSAGSELFAGVLPYDEVEGQQAELLGKLGEYGERLFAALAELEQARPVSAWRDRLGALLERMVRQDAENAWQHQRIRALLSEIAEEAAASGCEESVPLEVVRRLLEQRLDDAQPARGFLASGVTFCAMMPMRSIPFRVVCLLGLSDDAFPRRPRTLDFDLIRKSPRRRGDRSRRDDDRYLFLEAILAARERLYLSYVGRSVRDDAALPPSVVVAELFEALSASAPDIVTSHPLQPFSQRYFDGRSALFSYAAEHCRGAAALSGARVAATPLFARALEPQEVTAIDLEDLVRFFEDPPGQLLRRRLGIDWRERELCVPEREPLTLAGLDRWMLGDRLLELYLAGFDGDSKTVARAAALLPAGSSGACDHADVLALVEPLALRVRELRAGGRRPDLAISQRLADGVLLFGALGDFWANGLVRTGFARVKGKRVLGTWVRHLVASWAAPATEPCTSTLLGLAPRDEDGVVELRFRRVADAGAHLARLIELYRIGMQEPLLVFPDLAYDYAAALRDGRKAASALSAVRRDWPTVMGHKPGLERLFEHGDEGDPLAPDARPNDRPPLGPSFPELAVELFEPLFEHLERER